MIGRDRSAGNLEIQEIQAALTPLLVTVPTSDAIAGWCEHDRAAVKHWARGARDKLAAKPGAFVPPKPVCLTPYVSRWHKPTRRAINASRKGVAP